ncbi:putative lipooligosaccharide transport system, substrate-binding component (LptC family) [Campylobacter iguaniorum]|nr:putative lipooligosaccharide transport system, substrate-binding component (LptC family) [Campylobacter iguaniorum]
MVIKIFYVIISLFSVSMVFLMTQNPYSSKLEQGDISIANMEAKNIVDYELNATKTYARYDADNIIRYKNYDDISNFDSVILKGNTLHYLSSNKATATKDIITFYGDAKYKNSDKLNYNSERIIYNIALENLKSDSDFIMTQNSDKVVGKSVLYDMKDKKIFAKKVSGWYYTK